MLDEVHPVASYLDSLDRYDWHDRAACAGRSDLNVFPALGQRDAWSSGFVLAALLLCDRCPVRRECLEEGLRSWTTLAERDGHEVFGGHIRANGVWGGTVDKDRFAVRELSVTEAADLLEAARPANLARRIAARRIAAWRTAPRSGRQRVHGEIVAALVRRGESVGECAVCRAALPARGRRGPERRYCGARCRQRASRAARRPVRRRRR